MKRRGGMSNRSLLSIGEFSQLTGIPRSKLIYYDEIGLFSPAERGENGYRYYGLSQIITAGFINDMASFGVPLKDLVMLAHERTPESMAEVLDTAIEQHQKKINELKEAQSTMRVIAHLIDQGKNIHDTDIMVMEFEPINLILGNENIHQDATSFYPAWLAFMNAAKKAGISIKYPVGGYFEDMDRFLKNPNLPSRFYFVNPHGKHVREGGKWLTGYVRGFYGSTSDLSDRMAAYAIEHNLQITGPVYNTFLLDEMSTVDPANYLMRASVKIIEEDI